MHFHKSTELLNPAGGGPVRLRLEQPLQKRRGYRGRIVVSLRELSTERG